MSSSDIVTKIVGGRMTIEINREERRNALNDDVITQISDALSAAAADPAIRCVVLTGAGQRAFCAGGDLKPDSGTFKYDFSRIGTPFARLLAQARDCTLPLIARVNGHCMAGGMGLLGMCDLAVAADHAKFGTPEVKIGVFPMQIMSVLRDLIPVRKLREMVLTGEPLSAAEALYYGLVNYVVPGDRLDEQVDVLVERISRASPTAIRRGKFAMRQTEAGSFDETLSFMEAQIGILALTEDAAEGRRAFNEKREPEWPGR